MWPGCAVRSLVVVACLAAATSACVSVPAPSGSSQDDSGVGGGGGGGSDAGGLGGSSDASIGLTGDFTNVTASVNTDNALISFNPVDGAADYRIYRAPLLADGGVDLASLPGADGGTAMPGATYRCAGDREASRISLDNEPLQQGEAAHATVNGPVVGFNRATADATLGYVYLSPAADGLPVYALGDPSSNADNSCYGQRWDESRVKRYLTSDADRQTMIGQGWRDYGAVFYAPATASAATVQVYTAATNDFGKPRLYFAAGREQAARSGASAAFLALSAPAAGTAPLKRVFYTTCGWSHDELVAGETRFQRAEHQANVPLTSLQWTGLTGPTKLVIEALDHGCPWQGLLSPVSVNAVAGHQAFLSLNDIRTADPLQEVFVNGQHDGEPRPRAIARSFVDVSPVAADATADYRDGFDTDVGPLTEVPLNTDFAAKRFLSPRYDFSFYRIDSPPLALGTLFNEFWVVWADGGADLEAKFRMTATKKAAIAANSFLHVTLEVDVVSTDRRYPQILISNQDPPVQDNLPQGVTILAQTFGVWPARFELQICDHRTWGVTNQCPRFATDFYDLANAGQNNVPSPVVGELAGVDRRVRWDVYASTTRVYGLLDGQPMGCGILPAPGGTPVMPAGPVTVTFGDVLYHSGIDVPNPPYTFHNEHMHVETRRHMDEFAFKSGVAGPDWNEAVVPCTATTK